MTALWMVVGGFMYGIAYYGVRGFRGCPVGFLDVFKPSAVTPCTKNAPTALQKSLQKAKAGRTKIGPVVR